MRTINVAFLNKIGACEGGRDKFIAAHGRYRDVTLLEAYKSNGWHDFWWLVSVHPERFQKHQLDDLSLLSCEWASTLLHSHSNEFPFDLRPEAAIGTKRAHLSGRVGQEVLDEAVREAREASREAWLDANIGAEGGMDAFHAASAAVAAAGFGASSGYSVSERVTGVNCVLTGLTMPSHVHDIKALLAKWEDSYARGSEKSC